VLFGLMSYPLRKKFQFLPLAVVSLLVMGLLSVYLLFILMDKNVGAGYLKVTTEHLSEALGLGGGAENPVHSLISILDLLLLVFFLVWGVRIKSYIATFLAAIQVVPLAYFEFTYPEAAAEPFAFALDYLALVFILICSIIGSLIVLYAVKYMEDEKKQGRFFFFMFMFLGVMNGAVLSNNVLYLYFFWEATTLCCYFLIKHDETEEALRNAKWALEVTMAGGAALLLGMFMLNSTDYGVGSLSLRALLDAPSRELIVAVPVFLLALAAFTKSAQIPFQSWLTGAMVAPTPVSALLHSSTMVKLGVYLVLRMQPVISDYTLLASMVAVVGGFSFLGTSVLAIQETRMKRLLAYSTIGNLGLIMMLTAIGTVESTAAAVVLTIFHAISKALLFLSAGVIQKLFKTKDIEGSEGLFRRCPALFQMFAVGMFTMFLVPFGVFIAKYVALSVSIVNPIFMLIMSVGAILTEAFYIRWIGRTLTYKGEVEERSISYIYLAPMAAMAAGAVVLVILFPYLVDLLISPMLTGTAFDFASLVVIRFSWGGLIPLALLLVVVGVTAFMAFSSTGARKVRPYACGQEDSFDYTFTNPYFQSYIDTAKVTRVLEVVGAGVLLLTLISAIPLPATPWG